MKYHSFIVFLILLSFLPTMAETADFFAICKNQNNVRTLKIEKNNPAGCKAIYTKNGQDKIVANATSTEGKCMEVVTGIREKLLSSGWKCKDVKNENVTHSSEPEPASEKKK